MRDRASAGRDDAADLRDSAAFQRDAPVHSGPGGQPGLDLPVLARRAAAADREHSRQDRSAEALSRSSASADRGSAGQDRAHSTADRGAAEQDRAAASVDRVAGDDERGYAVLDRRGAHVDRDDAAADRLSASLDELTGAYLRRPGLLQLERDLDRSTRNGESLVVAFVDVDQLKVVNDQGGHAAGDRLLRAVARTLQGQLRPYDLIIRYGGDEFLCVSNGLDLDDVARRMADVNSVLAGGATPGTITFGLAQLHADETAHALIARADAALYRKRAGRAPRPS